MGRLNTFRIDYGDMPNKPGIGMVQKFCANELGLRRVDVIRIQVSRALGVTFVTVTSMELARRVCMLNAKKHEMTGSDKKKYPVVISLEDGAVEVKLHDLSVNVTDADVIKFLSKYGNVRSVYEETLGDDEEFAGAFTGVRIAKMEVTSNIGSWIEINGELTIVSYFGQRQTCRHCRDFLHIGASCAQNKKLVVQKTYADAAKQPAKPKQPSKPQQPKQNQPIAGGNPLPPPPPANPQAGGPRPAGSQPVGLQPNAEQIMPPPPTPNHPNGQKPTSAASSNAGAADGLSSQNSQAASTSSFLTPPAPDSALGNPNSSNKSNTSGNSRKSSANRNDGNDTDSSTGSTSSRRSTRGRPPGKKAKGDNERGEEEEQ